MTLIELVGEQGFRKLVSEFYRQIPSDDLLGPMYHPETLAEAERHLAGFLIYRFGGSDAYVQERGHPRLRMRHLPFSITVVERDRWVKLMDVALVRSEWPTEAVAAIQPFLHESATFLINRVDTPSP